MTRDEFQQRMKNLLPDISDQAMENWLKYAESLDRDGTGTESEFFDRSYVELFLVKRDHGPKTAVALFNYGEDFVFNHSKLRGAAALLSGGWPLERISHHAMEDGCEPEPEELTESTEALHSFQSGEWAVWENKQRFHTDLAYAARQLYALEKKLGGQEGVFAEWMRTAYELDMDFEQSFAEEVNEICSAFRNSELHYGQDIARQLYDTMAVVLPSEIQNAAQYLSLGGNLEHIPGLAAVGFLMGTADDESVARAVEYMNAGGDAGYAYAALAEKPTASPDSFSFHHQQFM